MEGTRVPYAALCYLLGTRMKPQHPQGLGEWCSGDALAQAMLIGRSRPGTGVLRTEGPVRELARQQALVGLSHALPPVS